MADKGVTITYLNSDFHGASPSQLDDARVIADHLRTTDKSYERVQLEDHIASGAANHWAVMAYSGSFYGMSFRYSTYEQAKDKFDSLPREAQPSLVLWTRLGSAVCFCFKGLPEDG